jgi:hypothetical protein
LATIRTILDPSSGFQQFASTRDDPKFGTFIKEFRFEVNGHITAIYNGIRPVITPPSLPTYHLVREFKFNELKTKATYDPDAGAPSAMKALKFDEKSQVSNEALNDAGNTGNMIQSASLRERFDEFHMHDQLG